MKLFSNQSSLGLILLLPIFFIQSMENTSTVQFAVNYETRGPVIDGKSTDRFLDAFFLAGLYQEKLYLLHEKFIFSLPSSLAVFTSKPKEHIKYEYVIDFAPIHTHKKDMLGNWIIKSTIQSLNKSPYYTAEYNKQYLHCSKKMILTLNTLKPTRTS